MGCILRFLWMTPCLHIMARNMRCEKCEYSMWPCRGQHGFDTTAYTQDWLARGQHWTRADSDICDRLCGVLATPMVAKIFPAFIRCNCNYNFFSSVSFNRSVLSLNEYVICYVTSGWLGSRVVSVLDSGGFKSQPRRCRVTILGKLFTLIVPLFTKKRNW